MHEVSGNPELTDDDLAKDIADQLMQLGKGARRLDCYFHRVDGHVPAIRVGTAPASREPRHLAKLLAAKIETIDPGLGIEAMTLVASLADPLPIAALDSKERQAWDAQLPRPSRMLGRPEPVQVTAMLYLRIWCTLAWASVANSGRGIRDHS